MILSSVPWHLMSKNVTTTNQLSLIREIIEELLSGTNMDGTNVGENIFKAVEEN